MIAHSESVLYRSSTVVRSVSPFFAAIDTFDGLFSVVDDSTVCCAAACLYVNYYEFIFFCGSIFGLLSECLIATDERSHKLINFCGGHRFCSVLSTGFRFFLLFLEQFLIHRTLLVLWKLWRIHSVSIWHISESNKSLIRTERWIVEHGSWWWNEDPFDSMETMHVARTNTVTAARHYNKIWSFTFLGRDARVSIGSIWRSRFTRAQMPARVCV